MEELLKMIETVDPADGKMLDEIDARVLCYLNDKNYVWHKRAESMTLDVFGWLTVSTGTPEIISFFSSYTRSRDALKSIRPNGWFFSVDIIHPWEPRNTYWRATAYKHSFKEKPYEFGSITATCKARCSTEELAELAAIIQAIAYERSKP